jgi:short-subunit dehydrogenase involved in D-alanine esterification of teichoic acids
MKFENNSVLITGGASGIGKIMGRMALEKGASRLIIWDINPQNINTTVEELSKIGTVRGYIVDVAKNDVVIESYNKVKAECGDIDILITDKGMPMETRQRIENMGVKLIIAE